LAVYCSQFLMSNLEQRLLEQNGKESIEFTPRMYYRDSVVLFVDISGFTSLTESLSKHEHGAEVMTKYVNGYFSLLVDVVTGHGGDVEKWSGDAMICVWYDQKQSLLELLQRTIHCGLDVQQQYGTFQAGNVLLTLHCAIAAGTLITFDIAGYNDRWLRYTFGSPFSELNTAVDESGAGQLIISKNTFEKYKLSNVVDVSRTTLGNYLVEELKVRVPKKAIPLIYIKSSLEPLMRRFVDPHVQNKIDADQARYLSEMKYATIGFISMHDRTEYATEEERLRDYSLTMKNAQEIIHRLEGTIVNFLQDEKGAILAVAFGYPIAHSNDPYRAIKCVMKILDLLRPFDILLGGGISSGNCFFGQIGSDIRSDFSVISDVANTAARLMKLSEKNGDFIIIVDKKTAELCGKQITFEEMEPVSLKGKREKLQICRVVQENRNHNLQLFGSPNPHDSTPSIIVGRELELEMLNGAIDRNLRRASEQRSGEEVKGNAIVIRGSSGLGKTFFVSQLFHREDKVSIKFTKQSIPDFTTAVEMAERMTTQEKKEILLSWISADHLPYAATLNTMFNVDFPETIQMKELDQHHRNELSAKIWCSILSYIQGSHGSGFPVFIFDNYQYFDELSKMVTQGIIQNSQCGNTINILILGDDGEYDNDTEQLLKTAETVITLKPLNKSQVEELLQSYAHCTYVSSELLDSVYERTGGNPLLIYSSYNYLFERGYISVLSDVLHFEKAMIDHRSVLRDMPGTTNAIIQQKIDKLNSGSNLVIKVASVIGQIFALRTLSAIFPEDDYSDDKILKIIKNDLIPRGLIRHSLNAPDLVVDHDQSFSSSVTRELCYAQVNGSLKRDSHLKIAEYLSDFVTSECHQCGLSTSEPPERYQRSCVEIAYHLASAHDYVKINSEEIYVDSITKVSLWKRELHYITVSISYLHKNFDYQRALSLLRRKLTILEDLSSEYDQKEWRSEQVRARFWLIRTLRKVLSIASPQLSDEIRMAELYCDDDHELVFDIRYESWFDSMVHSNHQLMVVYADKLEQLARVCNDDAKKIVLCLVRCMTSYSSGDFETVMNYAERGYEQYICDPDRFHEISVTSYQNVDFGVMLGLYAARSSLILGYLNKSALFQKRAETIAFQWENIRTREVFFLFIPYTHVIRRNFSELKRLMQLMQGPKRGNEREFDLILRIYSDYMNIFELEKQMRLLQEHVTDERHYKESEIGRSMLKIIHTVQGNLKQLESMTQPNLIVYYILLEMVLLYVRCNPIAVEQQQLVVEMNTVIDKCLQSHQKNLTVELLRQRAELSVGHATTEEVDNLFKESLTLAESKNALLPKLKILTAWTRRNPTKKQQLLEMYQKSFPRNEVDYNAPDFKDAYKVLRSLQRV